MAFGNKLSTNFVKTSVRKSVPDTGVPVKLRDFLTYVNFLAYAPPIYGNSPTFFYRIFAVAVTVHDEAIQPPPHLKKFLLFCTDQFFVYT